ncbi:hypothetical protein [Streptomyces sp. TS71-3]|uniref:hypothetical protein n=1 Tax=Streptomyces sp. TS71-3 TaxID=2733862 RepID=UPI001B0ED451|nr:hypothetical protein [Streptomyces sp. TS71-3]GHJ35140.1 hypothetical protein Sm713_07490 [Streptomyces sp. TS71-3]
MTQQQVVRNPIEDADAVCDELLAALKAAGITLPSLGVDPLSLAPGHEPRPLIELGRCNLATARKLIAVLLSADCVPAAPLTLDELARRTEVLADEIRAHQVRLRGGARPVPEDAPRTGPTPPRS